MNGWQHIYPLNEEHDLKGTNCICNPIIDWENSLVVHKSFKGKEVIEQAEEISKGGFNGKE